MRIAFDVKGTIDGPKQKLVLKLLKELQAKGHEIIVWSSMYGFALDAIKKHGLSAEAWPKRMQSDFDYDESKYVDYAIEDDPTQDWLAAKNFIWVEDLPSNIADIVNLANEIGGTSEPSTNGTDNG